MLTLTEFCFIWRGKVWVKVIPIVFETPRVQQDVSFVAWTTTPWTLPSNLALCVNPEMEYVQVRDEASGRCYILMAARLAQLYPGLNNPKKKADELKKFVELKYFRGSALAGTKYKPPFEYFEDTRQTQGSFRVITGAFVTDTGGTGIVHCAPAFGEDDYNACIATGIIKKGEKLVCPIDANGRFTEQVPEFEGQFVKDADKKAHDGREKNIGT